MPLPSDNSDTSAWQEHVKAQRAQQAIAALDLTQPRHHALIEQTARLLTRSRLLDEILATIAVNHERRPELFHPDFMALAENWKQTAKATEISGEEG